MNLNIGGQEKTGWQKASSKENFTLHIVIKSGHLLGTCVNKHHLVPANYAYMTIYSYGNEPISPTNTRHAIILNTFPTYKQGKTLTKMASLYALSSVLVRSSINEI